MSQSLVRVSCIAMLEPMLSSVRDRACGYSKLLRIPVWPPPAAQLLRLYAATLVRRIAYGQAGCLEKGVHKAFGLEKAHPFEEYSYTAEEHDKACYNQLSDCLF